MADQSTIAFTVEYLGTRHRVSVFIDPDDGTWMEEPYIGLIANEVKLRLLDVKRTKSMAVDRVVLGEGDVPKARPVHILDGDHVDADGLGATELVPRFSGVDYLKTPFFGTEGDPVLDTSGPARVQIRKDAIINFAQRLDQLTVLTAQLLDQTIAAEKLAAGRPQPRGLRFDAFAEGPVEDFELHLQPDAPDQGTGE